MNRKQLHKIKEILENNNKSYTVIAFEESCCEYCIHAHSRYILLDNQIEDMFIVETQDINGVINWESLKQITN